MADDPEKRSEIDKPHKASELSKREGRFTDLEKQSDWSKASKGYRSSQKPSATHEILTEQQIAELQRNGQGQKFEIVGLGDGSAEDTGTVIDYQQRMLADKKTFTLGMDYEERRDVRSVYQKLADFGQVSAKKAANPEEWQSYIQAEIDKMIGVGEGLNIAKEHTKGTVEAGWRALTDGTVAAFLSKPNALNDPLFHAVGGALAAMASDPNAVNSALERVGNTILRGSERYSTLSNREKGHMIGEAMFVLVNPEGSTEGAELTTKIVGTAVTKLDSVLTKTIQQTVKAAEDAALSSPAASQQFKRMLADYLKRKGLSVSDLENAGEIPKGYFDNLVGKGGEWNVLNERPSIDVVQQMHPKSCASACGEMLTNGAVKQEELVKRLLEYWPESMREPEMTSDLQWLAKELTKELGTEWKGGFIQIQGLSKSEKLDRLVDLNRSFCAELHEGGPMAHAVVVDGFDDVGNVAIRDPFHGTRYEMTKQEFLLYWNERALFSAKAR